MQKKAKAGDDPVVRPAKPATPKVGPKPTPAGATATDLYAFWDKHYKSHNDSPAEVFSTVAPLLKEKKFDHAEAALKAYLNNHGKQAEPWMYEWLIKTTEAQKGPEKEVRRAIGYAASIAKRTKRPDDLVRIADMMVIRNMYGPVGDPGYETNIGELVDMAADKLPSSAFPPMMSVNLASKTKDPKRMADAAERLLALGWAGPLDDKIRKNLSQQVEALGKTLQEEGKTEAAETLARKVAESEVRDVYVSLKWTGEADIDLSVEESLGAICRYQNPRTVFGGAMLKNGFGNHPEEVYVCPRGFDGDYTIRVDTIYTDEAKPVKEATLTVITHEGGADEKRQEYRVNLDKPTPVVVRLDKGRRKEALPYIPPPETVSLEGRKAAPTPAAAKTPAAGPAAPAANAPAAPARKGNKPIPVQ